MQSHGVSLLAATVCCVLRSIIADETPADNRRAIGYAHKAVMIAISPLKDADARGDKTVVVTLAASEGCHIGCPNAALVVIKE